MKIHIPTGWRRLKKIDKIRTTDKFKRASRTCRNLFFWHDALSFDCGKTESEVNAGQRMKFVFIRKKTQFR